MIKKTIFLLFLLTSILASQFDPLLLQVDVKLKHSENGVYADIAAQAFREVLVRVTGNKDIVIDESLSAEEFVKSVKYNERSARISFDAERVLNFIKNKKYTVWFGKRPKGLLFLVEEGAGKVFDFNNNLKDTLKASTKIRGVKIKVLGGNNVMNLSQNATMSKYLLDNGFDYHMLCEVSHFKGFDYIACRSPELGLSFDYEIKVDNYKYFTESIVNDLSDELARIYFSQSVVGDSYLRLKIDALNNYPEVQLVQKIVKSLTGVGFIEAEEINKDFVIFGLQYHGSIVDLSDLLDKDSRFLYKSKNLNERIFDYKWLGAV